MSEETKAESAPDSTPSIPDGTFLGCSGTMLLVLVGLAAVTGSVLLFALDLLFGLWQ